jgi:hypothetical protein
MKLDGKDYSEVDMDAFRRALAMALNSREPGRARMFERMLKNESWLACAKAAAHFCQTRTMQLPPFMSAPVNGPGNGAESDALLKRMLAAGISQFEPDPAAALSAKEQRVNSTHSNSSASTTQAKAEP